MEKFPHLRSSIVERLLETFMEMRTGRVFRGALWIIGEYALDVPGQLVCVRGLKWVVADLDVDSH